MDIQRVMAQLREETSRIEKVIAALAGLDSQPARRGRPPNVGNAKPARGRKRRTMSASARAKIAAAQRARWAKQKGKKAPKKVRSTRQEICWSPHESSYAEENVRSDEGEMGCEEEGWR